MIDGLVAPLSSLPASVTFEDIPGPRVGIDPSYDWTFTTTANYPPAIGLSLAVNGPSVTYSVTASDDGSVVLVEYWDGERLLGQSTVAPHTFTTDLSGSPRRYAYLYAAAYDDQGEVAYTRITEVGPENVSAAPGGANSSPSFTSTPLSSVTEREPYTYDVDATDPDVGDTLTYSLDLAPLGMTIDPATGVVSWTPDSGHLGNNKVVVRVSDAAGLVTQGFAVNVANVDDSPLITSTPVSTAVEDVLYSYNVDAVDPDPGDALTYSVDVGPPGMTIDTATGVIVWTPAPADLGDHGVTVRVTDPAGLSATQAFVVGVSQGPPAITSTPVSSATEDSLYSYDVDATDPDPGDTLTYSLDQGPLGIEIDPVTGLASWTPRNHDVGSQAVTVRVTDAAGFFDTQAFTVSVANVNDEPSITSSSVTSATEDAPYTYDVDATDPDVGDTLTYSLDVAPAGMTIDPATGIVSWTPTSTDLGNNDVTVRVTDAAGLFDAQAFIVSVANAGVPPSITSIAPTSATQDAPYSYDVDATDSDIGDTLTYSLDVAPAGMTIDPATGIVSWTPASTDVGDHAITVRVTDAAGLSDTQAFTVSVANVNDPPSITSIAVMTASENALYTYDVDATDPDAGDTLTYALDVAPAGMAIDPATGVVSWTPASTDIGGHNVTLRVTDAAGIFDTQTFTLSVANVDDPPSITSIAVTSASENTPYSYDVDATDPDAGDTLTYALDVAPLGMAIDPAMGAVSWTPASTDVGGHVVTVRVTDAAGLFDTQTFTLSVANVDDPPSITSIAVTSASENTPYSYDVDATDPDAGDTLTYALDVAPLGMAIDPATGVVSWTPASTDVGGHAVTVRVTDAAGLFDTQAFTLSVADVNDPPSITSIALTSATENTPYSYDVDATDPDAGDTLTHALDVAPLGMAIDPATGVLSWTPASTDVGGHAVTVRVTDAAGLFDTQAFTLSVSGATTLAVFRINAGGPDYTTADGRQFSAEQPFSAGSYGYIGGVSKTFGGSIAGTTDDALYLTVRGSRSATLQLDFDGLAPGDYDVTLYFFAPTGDNPGDRVFDVQAEGTTVLDDFDIWTAAGASMTAHMETFTASVTDGRLDIDLMPGSLHAIISAVEVVSTAPALPNDPPAITSPPLTSATEDVLYTYDVDATDPDAGDTLTYALDAAPAGMTIGSSTGVIAWTPGNGDVGSHAVTARVTDSGGLFDTQTYTLDVANTNDPPTITSSPVTSASEDVLYTYDVDATDPDAGDTLTHALDVAPLGMAIDPATGVVSWTPTSTDIGDNSVTVRVTDAAGLFDTQAFTLSVADVNDPPSITSIALTSATENTPYSYDVDATDPDAGDTLTHALDVAPLGMAIDPATGVVSWTPASTDIGDNSVTVRVTDAAGLFDTQAFTLSVADVNDPPSITSIALTSATENTPYSYDVDATDPDAGDTLTHALDVAPLGMAIDPATGVVSWTPASTDVGGHAVTVRVTDAAGLFDTQAFTLSVADVNDPPSITSIALTSATENTPYSYDVDATDPDAGDTLTYALDVAPLGMAIDPATGVIAWTPTSAELGGHNVTARVEDLAGLFDTQAFTVDVGSASPALAFRVNAGGPSYTTLDGRTFVADQAFAAGDYGYIGGVTRTFAGDVAGTDDDALFLAVRGHNSTTVQYDFDGLPAGDYDVTLYFFALSGDDPGERVFDVLIEGVIVLDDFDIRAAAGATLTAYAQTFTVTVADGMLDIDIVPGSLAAIVSAVEVAQAP